MMNLLGILISVCNFLGSSRRLVSVRAVQTDTRVWAKGRGGSRVRPPPTKHALYVFECYWLFLKAKLLSLSHLPSPPLQALHFNSCNTATPTLPDLIAKRTSEQYSAFSSLWKLLPFDLLRLNQLHRFAALCSLALLPQRSCFASLPSTPTSPILLKLLSKI